MRHVLGLKQWKWQRIGALAAAVCGVGVGLLKGLQPIAWLGIGSALILTCSVLTLYFVMLACPKIRNGRLLLSFVMVAFLSLVLNPPEAGFRAWERLGFFLLMLGLLSPLVDNSLLRRLRPMMWRGMMWGFRVVVFLSFIGFLCLCAGVKFLNNGYWMSFSGVTAGGMLLAPVTAVVLIDLLWRMFGESVRRWTFWGMLTASVAAGAMMLQAGSRIATLGVLGAVVVMLWFRRRRIRNLRRHPVAAALLVIIALGTAILIVPRVSDTIAHKFRIGSNHSSLTYSRDIKWEGRLEEFRSAPVFGIGFATQRVFSRQFDNETRSRSTGVVEPGSSWLSVLAQTGIAGFLLLSVFNLKLIITLLRRQRPEDGSGFYLAMLAFLLINGIAEGWILYAGSAMFFPYWALSGLIAQDSSPKTINHD